MGGDFSRQRSHGLCLCPTSNLIQEEGSPFALVNSAVKASTGKELSSEAYRQVSYVNDISFSNEQVLMERAVNGSLGESVTGYSYGMWRESYSVEAGTGASVGMETGSGTYYYTSTGSVANIVSGSGTRGYSYGPGGTVTVYGQGSLKSRTNTQAGFYGYNGEYIHGSLGLQYLRARYLKMETGTFTSRDTYAGRVRDILSQNRYTYAENNPVTFADPSGHKTMGAIIGDAFKNATGAVGNTVNSTKNQVNTKNPNKQGGVAANSTSNNVQTVKNVNESKKGITTQGRGNNNFIYTSTEIGEKTSQSVGMFYQMATQWAESVAADAARMQCETYDYCQNPTQKDILHFKYCDWKKHMMPLVGKNGEPQAGAEIAFNDKSNSAYKRGVGVKVDEKWHYRGNYQDFKDAIAFHESTNSYGVVNEYGYMGRYQMGKLALIDAGFMDSNGNWTELARHYGVFSKESFLNNREAQDAAFDLLVKKELSYINNLGLNKYIGQTMNGTEITESGLVAAIHLVGIGDTQEALEIGDLTSKADKNGTTAKEYMETFGRYNLNEVK